MAKSDPPKTGAKAGAKKSAAKAGAPAPARKRAGAAAPADLKSELRLFASARPGGWDHDDWMTFLDQLSSRGHDTSDPSDIGRQLERERLAVVLGQVRGLGPKRVDSLVGRFETLWSLRHATVDEIAAVPGMNRALAEQVRQGMS